MTEPRIFIGAPETAATDFEVRARAGSAEALAGHHFQFDDAILQAAPRLRRAQSLSTGTNAIVKVQALEPEAVVSFTRGMRGPQMSDCFAAMNSAQ